MVNLRRKSIKYDWGFTPENRKSSGLINGGEGTEKMGDFREDAEFGSVPVWLFTWDKLCNLYKKAI